LDSTHMSTKSPPPVLGHLTGDRPSRVPCSCPTDCPPSPVPRPPPIGAGVGPIPLRRRGWVEAQRWPAFTLLGQGRGPLWGRSHRPRVALTCHRISKPFVMAHTPKPGITLVPLTQGSDSGSLGVGRWLKPMGPRGVSLGGALLGFEALTALVPEVSPQRTRRCFRFDWSLSGDSFFWATRFGWSGFFFGDLARCAPSSTRERRHNVTLRLANFLE